MAVPVSLIVCFGIALLVIGFTVWGLIELHRRPEPPTLAAVIERTHKVVEAFEWLGYLDGNEREALCRQIARDIRDNCETLIWLIDAINGERAGWGKEARDEPAFKLSMETRCLALRVYWQARRILFLFRFRPSLVRDCHRLADMALQHRQTWMAYLRFLREQYPETLGDLTILDPNDWRKHNPELNEC